MPTAGFRTRRRSAPRCKTCGKRVHVPAGWSDGSAVRRHYWRYHRDAMTAGRRARRG